MNAQTWVQRDESGYWFARIQSHDTGRVDRIPISESMAMKLSARGWPLYSGPDA